MKKESEIKKGKSLNRNIAKGKKKRAFSIIFSIALLCFLFTEGYRLSVQAAEDGKVHVQDGLHHKERTKSETDASENIETVSDDTINFSRKKESAEECEELLTPALELQDYLEGGQAEPQELPEPEVNYTPVDDYPWGKAMSASEITLVAPDSEASQYQWQKAELEEGEFEDIDSAESRECTFTPENGKWYRVVMDNSVSRAVQAFQTPGNGQIISGTGAQNLEGTKMLKVYKENQWHLTNGFVAYTSVSSGSTYQCFDVLGKYTKNGITYWMNTAYSAGWQLFTNDSAKPAASSGTLPGNAVLSELRFQFGK